MTEAHPSNARDWHALELQRAQAGETVVPAHLVERADGTLVVDTANHPDIATEFSEAGHAIRGCAGCPQRDDHPRVLAGSKLYHHDCLPAILESDATRNHESDPMAAAHKAVIDACKGGLKGDALREYLIGPHLAEHGPKIAAVAHAGPSLAEINQMHADNIAAGRHPFAEPES